MDQELTFIVCIGWRYIMQNINTRKSKVFLFFFKYFLLHCNSDITRSKINEGTYNIRWMTISCCRYNCNICCYLTNIRNSNEMRRESTANNVLLDNYFTEAQLEMFQDRGGFLKLVYIDKYFIKKSRKKAPQEKFFFREFFFLLDTFKATFWMANLT